MTKAFEKILIATDGSVKNQPAVRKGLELAHESGSSIHAIYVIEVPLFTASQTDGVSEMVYRALEDEGQNLLNT